MNPRVKRGVALGAEQCETKLVFDEIRSLLAKGGTVELKSGKPTSRPPKSPFAVVPGFVKELQKRQNPRGQSRARKFKDKKIGTLDVVIAERPSLSTEFSHDEVRAKSVLMPYADTTMAVQERVRLVESWRRHGMQIEHTLSSFCSAEFVSASNFIETQDVPTQLSAVADEMFSCTSDTVAQPSPSLPCVKWSANKLSFTKVFRRYPRLTSIFNLKDIAISSVKVRSNAWMAKFMEGCYDEAFKACFKPISDARRVRRCGMDLGGLDAFPLIVQRLISRVYSVMEVRQRVCFEILFTLESIITLGEESLLSTPPTSDANLAETSIDGGRAQLFSRFLSEELHLDYLALFLHCRDLIQKEFSLSLVDANPQHILPTPYLNSHPSQMPPLAPPVCIETTSRDMPLENMPAESVVVPRSLPCGLHYILDVTMPHAPLVCFSAAKLPWICGVVAPTVSTRLKKYLIEKVVNYTNRLYDQSQRRVQSFLESIKSPLQVPFIKKLPSSNVAIPISVLLFVMLEEWRAVPVDAKARIGTTGVSSESLRALNDIYSGDNAKIRAFSYQTREIETKLAVCDACMLQLEKARKRLDRKFKNNFASADEIAELQQVRVKQTELKAERTAIETQLKITLKRESIVKDSLDELWLSASLGTEIETEALESGCEDNLDKVANRVSTWRTDVDEIIVAAMSYNEESFAAIRRANDSFNAPKNCSEMQMAKHEQEEALKMGQSSLIVTDPSVADQIAALEVEALALSRVGNNELRYLGIDFPTPPEFIQSFLKAKEQKVQFAHDLERDQALETSRNLEMTAEELLSRRFLIDESLAITYNQGVMSMEDSRMRQFIQMEAAQRATTISRVARVQMTTLINVALKEIAEITLLRQVEEIAKSQEARLNAQVFELKAVIMKQISVTVGAFIAAAVNTASQTFLDGFAQVAAQEALNSRIVAISSTASSEVSSFLSLSVAKIVQAAAHAFFVTHERERNERQRDQLSRQYSTITVQNVVSLALYNAKNRLEDDMFFLLDLKINELAEVVVTKIIIDLVVIQVDAAVATQIEISIDEAVQTDILRQKYMQDSAKARRHLLFQAKKIARSMVTIVTSSAIIAASKVLTDPWRPLIFAPHEFLTKDLLTAVEEAYRISREKIGAMQKRRFMRGLRFPVIRKNYEHRRKLEIWTHMRRLVEHRLLRFHMAHRIQRATRTFIKTKERGQFAARLSACIACADSMSRKYRKKRALKFLRWWKYWAHAENRGKIVTFNIRERRFLICFYTWRMHFFNARDRKQRKGIQCDKAALVIQCVVRRKLAYSRVKIIRAVLTIVNLGNSFLARRRVRQLIRRARILHENFDFQRRISFGLTVFRQFRQWKVAFRRKSFFHLMHRFVIGKLARKRFMLWKRGYQNLSKLLNDCATTVQSAVRMWIIKRYVLNFFRFRRGVVALQSHARRRIINPFFCVELRFYRAAIVIQRVFRGLLIRSGLTARRVIDVHFAARSNRYERLHYYAHKYRPLLHTFDPSSDGNTALHSAAIGAAKRTLKLLVKCGLDPNQLNFEGYTPLHLAIVSPAVNRDDTVMYMLEHGFDEEQPAPGGKSSLLLAVEYGRGVIATQLLANGMNPNIPDDSGSTCLQAACSQGFFSIAVELLSYGADPNMPGYCGCVPLHDCIATGNVDFPNTLLRNGAYVNVVEPFNGQTPLMWAARAGLPEFVKLYVVQGAHINARDKHGWSAAHHGAVGPAEYGEAVYEALRFGDADFDAIDNEGNTPLHIAAQYGSNQYADALLLGCVHPSVQNIDGNQPSHIAARDNNLAVLKHICAYDTHIGRINFNHQTPLGIAKFNNAFETRDFLEEHYRKVEIVNGRNKVGDIWWDRIIDEVADEWTALVGFLGEREYVNIRTGERSLLPPSVPSFVVRDAAQFLEVPIRRKVVLVDEENTLTRHSYKKEYQVFGAEVSVMARVHRASVCIQKFTLRKLAYLELARLKLRKMKLKTIGIFIKRRIRRFMTAVINRRNWQISKLQAAYRGQNWRQKFFLPDCEFRLQLIDRKARRILGRNLLELWRKWKRSHIRMKIQIAANLPSTKEDWQLLADEARKPLRVVGMYEEYIYPGSFKIYFYRHRVSQDFCFEKPAKLRALDVQAFKDGEQIRKFGCTFAQRDLIVKLQALWRGYKVRSYYLHVETSMGISLSAEVKYMTSPDQDSNLYNYALYCHCIQHDWPRARGLYYESMRRMEWRGPDVAFVLYSYAIFAAFTHDLDFSDILGLLERGRVAEETREVQLRKARGEEQSQAITNGTFRHGQVFELANIGFFRHYAMEHENEASWHNYGLCRFLIFNDFVTSFDAFLMAFKYAPSNKKLKSNFDTMMTHFHGSDKKAKQEIVKKRMTFLAARDQEIANLAQWRRENAHERSKASQKIKKWWKNFLARRRLKGFFDVVMHAKTIYAKRQKDELDRVAVA